MKLISCHIAGFGRIKDLKLDFDCGICEFFEENGWGKTTLSVFLKSMFYGLEYSPRKKELTERAMYEPWDGGVYGGNLVFSVDEKLYRIERTFGQKDKDDTFAIYDLPVETPSSAYTSNIGEELFEVDRESFERSIFIPQDSLEVGITDSLNAKMGGVASVSDDMKNYEEVVKRIETAAKEYTSSSRINPGRIKKITEDITSAREMSESIPTLQEAYEAKCNLLATRQQNLHELESQKSEISARIKAAGAAEQRLGELRAKQQSLEGYKQTQATLDDFFARGVPADEDLDEWDSRERDLEVNRSRREELRSKQPSGEDLDVLVELFEDRPIGEEKLTEWSQQADKIKELRLKGTHSQMTKEDRDALTDLKNFFRKKLPDPEEIKEQLGIANQEIELSGKLKTQEERYSALRKQMDEHHESKSGHSSIASILIFILLTLTLFFGGFYFKVLFSAKSTLTDVIAYTCVGLGVMLIISFVGTIILRYQRDKRDREKFEQELWDASDELEATQSEHDRMRGISESFLADFDMEYEDIQQAIIEVQRRADRFLALQENERQFASTNSDSLDELSELQLKLYTSLAHYTTVLGVNLYDTQDEDRVIRDLSVLNTRYRDFQDREKEIHRVSGEITAESDGLRAVVSSYPVEEPDSIPHALKEIRQKVMLYSETGKRIEEITEELKEYEETPDSTVETESLASLQEKQQALEEEITELKGYITDDIRDLDERSQQLSDCEDAAGRIPALEEDRAEMEEQVRLYEETLQCLGEAKENFLSAYMGPLQRSMTSYLRRVYPGGEADILAGDIRLDMNLDIQLQQAGITRSGKHLSAGYHDMAAFCARLALVDVLFGGESPMIVMDDPFTNFDEDKLEKAKELVREVSEKHQIIYFTCHGSRSVKEAGR